MSTPTEFTSGGAPDRVVEVGRLAERPKVEVEVEVEVEELDAAPTQFVFKEMLSDDDDSAVPTYDQLERFGLFDVSICTRSLAEYRAKYPLPQDATTTTPGPGPDELDRSDDGSSARPSPQHRHSIAIAPFSATLDPSSSTGDGGSSPPLASPGLATAATRLNPFSLARRATASRSRPAQHRTKSTNDVLSLEAAVPPLLTREEVPLAPPRPTTLDRESTIKDRRAAAAGAGAGPRKLRRNPASRPALPVLRTDDEFLLRPSAAPPPSSDVDVGSASPVSSTRSPNHHAPSSLSSASSSPVTSRKYASGWRHSLSTFVSSPVVVAASSSSPTSFELPSSSSHKLFPPPPLPRAPRSPSPIGAFPAAIRRERALPPVDSHRDRDRDRARKDSLSDSYLGDSEQSRYSTMAVPRSPSSPVSTGGGTLWARAFKLGGGGGGGGAKRAGATSRASSVASSSTSTTATTTSWDLLVDVVVDREGRRESVGEPPTSAAGRRGTFEVLRKPSNSNNNNNNNVSPRLRPTTGEWVDSEPSSRSPRTAGQPAKPSGGGGSGSSLDSSQIPESLEPGLDRHHHHDHPYFEPGSITSPPSCGRRGGGGGGFGTPPAVVTANSSTTVLAAPAPPHWGGTSPSLRSSRPSSSCGGDAEVDRAPPSPPPPPQSRRTPRSRSRSRLRVDQQSCCSSSSIRSSSRRTGSNASTTSYRSVRSSSSSPPDSLFSTTHNDDDDDEGRGESTGATSVTEGEDDDYDHDHERSWKPAVEEDDESGTTNDTDAVGSTSPAPTTAACRPR